jgi:hypothetical protein
LIHVPGTLEYQKMDIIRKIREESSLYKPYPYPNSRSKERVQVNTTIGQPTLSSKMKCKTSRRHSQGSSNYGSKMQSGFDYTKKVEKTPFERRVQAHTQNIKEHFRSPKPSAISE